MKKLNILFLTIAFVFASCEFDEGFEEMNVNPTASTDLGVNPKFAYLFLKSAGEEYEVSFTEILCAGQLVQQVLDIQFPQGSIYTIRQDLNYAWWETQYGTTIKSVVDIIAQLDAEGNSGSEMGIARIWRAFIFHKLVDTYGDTPYFEAGRGFLDGNVRPVYDSAESIYMDMLNELDQAVAQIGGSTTLGDSDLIFGGDTSKWKKLGNSLMLRLAMRIKNVDASTSSTYVNKAISGGVMQSLEDNAYMEHTNGPTDLNRNAWGTYVPRYVPARLGKTIYDWLADHNDPRLNIIANPNGPKAGIPYGYGNLSEMEAEGITWSDYVDVNPAITKLDSPRMFLTYPQTALMLAENSASSGDHVSAEQHYNNGVKAAMKQWALWGSSLEVSDADVASYLTANPYDSAKWDEMIGEQFWAASFFDFFESFANWRRTGYPDLKPFGGRPAHPTNVTNGTIPRRLILNEAAEGSVNTENYNAMISRQGPNTLTTKVWWDR